MELIVAVDENWAIGQGGDQLVYLKEDLKRFQALTMGRTVILGRKTLATFPGGRPLKGRENLILSTDPTFRAEGGLVFHTLDELLAHAPNDSIVIGGASVYKALLPRCSTAHVTRIHAAFPADTWFPDLEQLPDWSVTEESAPLHQDGISYHYATYVRRKV